MYLTNLFIPDPMLSTGTSYKHLKYSVKLELTNWLINWLLDLKHHGDFDELYGTEAKEFLPSASDSAKEAIPNGIINNSHIRKFVNCTICNKLRCIFNKSALNDEEKTSLEILLDNVTYVL